MFNRGKRLWRTARGEQLSVEKIGDAHLVNCLNMIEANVRGRPTLSGFLPKRNVDMYVELAVEAIRRGLFIWDPERKYVAATALLAREYEAV